MAVGRRGSLWLLKRRLTGRHPSIDASGTALRNRPDRLTRNLAASSGAVPGGGRRWASALHAGERYEKSRNKTNVGQLLNGVEGPQPPRVFGFFLRVKKETAPSRAVATTKNKKHRKIPKTKPRANARQTLPKAQSSHHPHPHLSPHKKIYEKPLRACPRNGGTQWQPQSRTSRGRQA